MTRSMRSTLTFLTGSSVAQAASFAAGSVVSTRLLGPHGRGLMVLGAAIGSTTALLAGMGTGVHLRSRLPKSAGADRMGLLASYTWWTIIGALAAGGLAALLSALSAGFIEPGLAEPLFLLAVLVIALGYVTLGQLTEPWYATGQFRTGSIWLAMVSASGTAAMFVAAVFARTAWALLLAQGIGMLAASAVQAHRLHRQALLTLRWPDRRELSRMIRSGSPSLGLTVGLAITLKADRYVLGALAGASAVGIYALVSTLSEIPRLIPASLGQIVMRETAVGADFKRSRRARTLAVAAAAAVGSAVGAAGWILIGPVFGADFAQARPLLLLLLIAEITFAPFTIASRGLMGAGYTGIAGGVGMIGGLVATLSFAVSIPQWGLYGAAVSSIVAYFGMSTVSWILFRQLVGSPPARHAARRTPRPANSTTAAGTNIP